MTSVRNGISCYYFYFLCLWDRDRFFLLSSFENTVYTLHICGLCFFSPNDLIYNLLFCVNDLWFTMRVSKILSLEQYLYHVILNKSVYSGNMLQVFIITDAIVLLIWKVFWICLFPPILQNLNTAAATGISPVSVVETVLSCSTKTINLRDVKHSWYFSHLKVDNFKLFHSSCIQQAAPSLRMRLDGGLHTPFSETHDDQRLQVWVISQHPLLILAAKVFCSHTATIACSYRHVPGPSWNAEPTFLNRGSMGIWHCCVTELLAWVFICSPSVSSFPWVLPGQCSSCRQRCIWMKCRAAGSLHLHSWF